MSEIPSKTAEYIGVATSPVLRGKVMDGKENGNYKFPLSARIPIKNKLKSYQIKEMKKEITGYNLYVLNSKKDIEHGL